MTTWRARGRPHPDRLLLVFCVTLPCSAFSRMLAFSSSRCALVVSTGTSGALPGPLWLWLSSGTGLMVFVLGFVIHGLRSSFGENAGRVDSVPAKPRSRVRLLASLGAPRNDELRASLRAPRPPAGQRQERCRDSRPLPASRSTSRTECDTAYNRPRIWYFSTAPSLSTGRKGDRHGQGSDAQQQGKEETEGRQEPQEGRRYALAVLVRQDAGRPKPQQQEIIHSSSSLGQRRQRVA